MQALQETLAKQDRQIESLDERLSQTLKQVQDLAFRAIESGSQATSYEAVREIALQQARGKQGKATEE